MSKKHCLPFTILSDHTVTCHQEIPSTHVQKWANRKTTHRIWVEFFFGQWFTLLQTYILGLGSNHAGIIRLANTRRWGCIIE